MQRQAESAYQSLDGFVIELNTLVYWFSWWKGAYSAVEVNEIWRLYFDLLPQNK